MNKIKDFRGLHRITSNQYHDYAGLLVHVNMVFDRKTHAPYGLSSIEFVDRAEKSRRVKREKQKRNAENIEEKESNKWLAGFKESKRRLCAAKQIVLVGDREADIIELLDRLPDKKTDLVIRSCHNRNVIDVKQRSIKLYDLFEESESVGSCLLSVDGKKRKKRLAVLDIKVERIIIPWAAWKKVNVKKHPQGVPVKVIKVQEHTHHGYDNEAKLQWYLITTLPTSKLEEIVEVIDIYKRRWSVEEYFKLLKSDGYDLERTELASGKSIRTLTLYTMKASIKVQQIKAARDGKTKMPIQSVFSAKEINYLNKINPTLEGKTEKQKNPYPPESLAYAAWIIARLGGWKEFYDSKRPPGTKTIVWGLEKFETMMIAVNLLDVS